MATHEFSWGGFWLRSLFGFLLVSLTYNPLGYSFTHVVMRHADILPTSILALFGVILLIGWMVYLRATLRSLGAIGLILAFAGFGTLVWVLFDYGVLSVDDPRLLHWVAIVIVAFVLAIGMSWSHVRRRLSGQIDADDVDED